MNAYWLVILILAIVFLILNICSHCILNSTKKKYIDIDNELRAENNELTFS